jgi:hypothetical protein
MVLQLEKAMVMVLQLEKAMVMVLQLGRSKMYHPRRAIVLELEKVMVLQLGRPKMYHPRRAIVLELNAVPLQLRNGVGLEPEMEVELSLHRHGMILVFHESGPVIGQF